jgi:DNA replication and repair protein RecF
MNMKITSLTLSNFRKFENKTIRFPKAWTILIAPNATGKSTVIEALYMLSHGDSPWESQSRNIVRFSSGKTEDTKHDKLTNSVGRIEGTIETEDDIIDVALALNANGSTTSKKFQIQGSNTNRQTFLRHINAVLFSPDMIDLLMYDPSQRRSFLDAHAGKIYPDYYNLHTNYYKVLRQRNSLLKALAGKRYNGGYQVDTSTLSYWTKQLTELGTEIMANRLELIEKINSQSDQYPAEITYRPKVLLHDLSDLGDMEHIRDLFEQALEKTQKKEQIVGTTLVGPHRDDWHLTDKTRNLNTYGSRGEKRMAIADVIFKLNLILKETRELSSILLLDDIFSELDEKNVDVLFTRKLDPKQQTIITTTTPETVPAEIRSSAHIVEL